LVAIELILFGRLRAALAYWKTNAVIPRYLSLADATYKCVMNERLEVVTLSMSMLRMSGFLSRPIWNYRDTGGDHRRRVELERFEARNQRLEILTLIVCEWSGGAWR